MVFKILKMEKHMSFKFYKEIEYISQSVLEPKHFTYLQTNWGSHHQKQMVSFWQVYNIELLNR